MNFFKQIVFLYFNLLLLISCLNLNSKIPASAPETSQSHIKNEPSKSESISRESLAQRAEQILKRALSPHEIEVLEKELSRLNINSLEKLDSLTEEQINRFLKSELYKIVRSFNSGLLPHETSKLIRQARDSEIDKPNYKISGPIWEKILHLEEYFEDNHNVMLIGPTGSGKTSLVEFFATLKGKNFVRINLHNMASADDLLGKFQPRPDGSFEFVESPFTLGLRNGDFILLDEANLAETSILERLNASLDDFERRLVVSERFGSGSSTQKFIDFHPDTMIFVAINPENYSGRKQMSEAFEGRFVKMLVDEMTPQEYKEIVDYLFEKNNLPARHFLVLQALSQALINVHLAIANATHSASLEQTLGIEGGPYAFTLRDLSQVVTRVSAFRKLSKLSLPELFLREVREVYLPRFQSESDRSAIEKMIRIEFGNDSPSNSKNFLVSNYGAVLSKLDCPPDITVTDSIVSIGDLSFKRRQPVSNVDELIPKDDSGIIYTPETRRRLYQIAKADFLDLPLTAVGPSGVGKSILFRHYAYLKRMNYLRFSFSEMTDNSSLVGSFVQSVDPVTLKTIPGKFEWSDGDLVRAMKNDNYLVVFDEINNANPAIIELLNPLQDRREIRIMEHAGEVVKAVPSFRYAFTINPSSMAGRKELSPAMRNRSLESFWPSLDQNQTEMIEILNGRFLRDFVPSNDADRIIALKAKAAIRISVKFYSYWVRVLEEHKHAHFQKVYEFTTREIVRFAKSLARNLKSLHHHRLSAFEYRDLIGRNQKLEPPESAINQDLFKSTMDLPKVSITNKEIVFHAVSAIRNYLLNAAPKDLEPGFNKTLLEISQRLSEELEAIDRLK